MGTTTASLGLGQHVDDVLAKHHSEHSDKVNQEQDKLQSGREERKEQAESLGRRLIKMAEANGGVSSEKTISSPVPKELENGTLMVVHLEPIGSFEKSVNEICSAKYVNEGAVAAQLAGRELSPGEITEMGLDHGIVVNVSLHSQDEELGVETEHQVHVGNIIDPESVLVPEPNDDQGRNVFKIVDSSDSRFQPIMDLVAGFFESDAQKISEELAQVS